MQICVVIAIIAILAAMLLPALGKAREQGRNAHCKSNLKQIGLGLTMYCDSMDGWFPPDSSYPKLLDGKYFTYKSMVCKTKSNKVYSYPFMNGTDKISYLFSIRLAGVSAKPASGEFDRNVKLSMLQYTSIDPVTADAYWTDQDGPYTFSGKSISLAFSDGNPGVKNGFFKSLPHDSKSNLLHVDGHVTMQSKESYTANILRKGDTHPINSRHLTE